jgi:hypothetical protein
MGKRFTLKHWVGREMGVERIYVRDADDDWGYFDRCPHSKCVTWGGVDGGSPEVLDALFGAKRIGAHSSWRAASEEGDGDTIWRALLYAAGVGR